MLHLGLCGGVPRCVDEDTLLCTPALLTLSYSVEPHSRASRTHRENPMNVSNFTSENLPSGKVGFI
jgi:hypothetical protein